MGDFHLNNEYKWRNSTWVEWTTPNGQVVYVLLRNTQNQERCIGHFENAIQFDEARRVFVQYIGPNIDADITGGKHPLTDWQDVHKYYYPDATGGDDVKKAWTYIFSWDNRAGGALILYHLNPPGYQFDEPFVGSDRHRDWWEQGSTDADADLHWPFHG